MKSRKKYLMGFFDPGSMNSAILGACSISLIFDITRVDWELKQVFFNFVTIFFFINEKNPSRSSAAVEQKYRFFRESPIYYIVIF
jgi:hypothetical protein